MKKIILALAAALIASVSVWAQKQEIPEAGISGVEFALDDTLAVLTMTLDISAIELPSNSAVIFTPVVYKGAKAVQFPTAGLYSRGRFYSMARAGRTNYPLPGMHYYEKEVFSDIPYKGAVPYEDWMAGAKLRIDRHTIGCCGKESADVTGEDIPGVTVPDLIPEPEPMPIPVTEPEPEPEPEPVVEPEPQPEPEPVVIPEFKPEYVYVLPPAEASIKQRDISGEAYVVFGSGKTEVDPEYLDNTAELEKIRATIDSVRTDPDMSITEIVLRGYSSPDGSYAVNEKLAAARTEAIKTYVSGLYSLPTDVYTAESVPENWDGLRKAVEASSLQGKDKILAIIDSDAAPDTKEARIKKNYPKAWQQLVKEVFPSLRRTDYNVSYTVRSYTTREEILEILNTRPSKLSVGEFFLAAEEYVPGTPEFNQIMAIAARVYPFIDAISINAANAAMEEGNLGKASHYLDGIKGDSPEGRYAKGVYNALSGNWEEALKYFTSAEVSGMSSATPALEQVKLIIQALSK